MLQLVAMKRPSVVAIQFLAAPPPKREEVNVRSFRPNTRANDLFFSLFYFNEQKDAAWNFISIFGLQFLVV